MTTPEDDWSEGWINPITDAIVSMIKMTGYFDKVQGFEPDRKPGSGMTAAVWFAGMRCIGAASGLDKSTAMVTFMIRLYQNRMMEPKDIIDPRLSAAASNIIRRYHDDFDFDGAVGHVDLLGAYSDGLTSVSGYLDQDKSIFRVIDISVPCVVYNVWTQDKGGENG